MEAIFKICACGRHGRFFSPDTDGELSQSYELGSKEAVTEGVLYEYEKSLIGAECFNQLLTQINASSLPATEAEVSHKVAEALTMFNMGLEAAKENFEPRECVLISYSRIAPRLVLLDTGLPKAELGKIIFAALKHVPN